MDCFIKKFQPERYELWKAGEDIGYHPEDPFKKMKPAPLPYGVELELETCPPKSKRQATARSDSKKSNKSKKRMAEDCSKFNTVCLDEEYFPLNDAKQPKKKQKKKKNEKSEPSSSSNETDTNIDNLSDLKETIKHPKVIIKRDHQLLGFVQSSALDKLCEETKINIIVPYNNINLDNVNFNSKNDLINNNSISTENESSKSTDYPLATLPTKAALKQYDDCHSSNLSNSNKYEPESLTTTINNCDKSTFSTIPQDPRLSSKRYSPLFNLQSSQSNNTQTGNKFFNVFLFCFNFLFFFNF